MMGGSPPTPTTRPLCTRWFLLALTLVVLPTGASGQGAVCTQDALEDLREGLARGADVAACVEAGDLDVTELDLPLAAAAKIGNLALMVALLRAGADPNDVLALVSAMESQAGGEGAVLALLRYGMDPNIRILQGTPLHLAIWLDRVDVVLLLLRYGADLDARNEDGETPLELAERLGSVASTVVLRQRSP